MEQGRNLGLLESDELKYNMQNYCNSQLYSDYIYNQIYTKIKLDSSEILTEYKNDNKEFIKKVYGDFYTIGLKQNLRQKVLQI
jgi:hypothetical protein